jgi:hypothetical protein
MKKMMIMLTAMLIGGSAVADVTLFSEDFSGSVGTDYFGGVGNFAYGYDPGAAYKKLEYSQWGAVAAAATFTGGVAIPNPTAGTSSKSIGTFLDPSLFAGYEGETLTLHFDIIGDTGGIERNARAWVYEASGYDTSGNNDWHLALDAALNSGNPMDNLLIDDTAGGATVTELVKSVDLITAVDSTDNTLTFTYSAGTGIGLAFGSYNTDMAFDNVSITVVPEPGTFGLLSVCGAAILYVRRKIML